MKTFKKTSNLVWKRNKLWIGIVLILILLLSINSSRNQTSFERGSSDLYAALQIDEAFDDNGKLKKDFFENYDDSFYSMVDIKREELKDGIPEDYLNKVDAKYKKAIENYKEATGYFIPDNSKYYEEAYNDDGTSEDYRIGQILSSYYYSVDTSDNFIKEGGNIKFSVASKIYSPKLGLLVLAFFLGLILLSLNHLTSYYEFTRTLALSPTKVFVSKYIFGLIFLLLAYGITTGAQVMAYKTSLLSNIVSLSPNIIELALSILSLVSFYSLVMAAGALAGNFLGHMGIFLIGFLGLDLIHLNIRAFSYLITGEDTRFKVVESFMESIPGVLRPTLFPMDTLSNFGYRTDRFVILGYAISILVFLALGLIFTKRARGERSQMLVLARGESLVIKVLAIFTTANLIANISGIFGVGTFTTYLSLGVFVLALIFAYKFYNFLFSAKIGIS